MARIRTIKPEFWTSEQVVECSPTARLMFIGMWNFCDDYGNHPASYKTLKMEVFPGDEISLAEIEGLTKELIKNGLLIEYDGGNGRRYWHVTGWHHQKVDKPNSKHPPFNPSKVEKFDDHSSNAPRTFDDHSPPEGKGMEGNSKGKEESLERGSKILTGVSANEKSENPDADASPSLAQPPPVSSLKLTQTRISQLFQPTEAAVRLAQKHGLDVGTEADLFVAHYESTGEFRVDWQACFRKWLVRSGQRKAETEKCAQGPPLKGANGLKKFDAADYNRGNDGYGRPRKNNIIDIDGIVVDEMPSIQGPIAD